MKEKMNLASAILSDITVYTKYARFMPELSRRESWEELVDRNMKMHMKKYPHMAGEIENVYGLVLGKKILPSMRSMQFGGRACEVNPARVYNCSYLPIDNFHAFSEALFLLLSGTGVGYSIQKRHVSKLPPITKPDPNDVVRYLVGDSIEGWADAVKALLKSYFFGGSSFEFDFSDIREKGAVLITSGGKAPGPKPLKDCIERLKELFDRKNVGERLEPIEVHDMLCHIADAVLVGGIRRAAMICLFDKDDDQMMRAKSSRVKVDKIIAVEHPTYTDKDGEQIDTKRMVLTFVSEGVTYEDMEIYVDKKTGRFFDMEQYQTDGTLGWWVSNPQRGRANNSAVLLRSETTEEEFQSIWKKIQDSGAGEPGVYFTNDLDWGTNPCVEIALKPFQFCNLTEVNVSDIESQEDLNERVRGAAFIGTLQAGYTSFHYLRKIWRETTERGALIGVSMTGIASGAVLNYDMTEAANEVKKENERVSKLIGIRAAERTTCVKPAGTTSLTLGTSSGIHAWHAEYYLRRMRFNKNEAIYSYLISNHPELVEDNVESPEKSAVLTVPQMAPKGSILRNESAVDLLERVKRVTNEWIKPGHREGVNTHNVSATISIKPTEWKKVGEWMWDNKDSFSGLSCLPYDNGSYKQAPFEDCTKEKYEELLPKLKSVDLTKIVEHGDARSLIADAAACGGGGSCEIK